MVGRLNELMIDEVLEENIIGRLGYTDGHRIFIIPISYLYYDRRYLLAHSREGKKIEIFRKNPDICLSVDQIQNLSNWKSVLIWGKYEEITDKRERYYALDLLIRRIFRYKSTEKAANPDLPGIDESMIIPDREKAIVYRIKIEKVSGRFEINKN